MPSNGVFRQQYSLAHGGRSADQRNNYLAHGACVRNLYLHNRELLNNAGEDEDGCKCAGYDAAPTFSSVPLTTSQVESAVIEICQGHTSSDIGVAS